MCVFKYHAFIYFLRPPPWYGTIPYPPPPTPTWSSSQTYNTQINTTSQHTVHYVLVYTRWLCKRDQTAYCREQFSHSTKFSPRHADHKQSKTTGPQPTTTDACTTVLVTLTHNRTPIKTSPALAHLHRHTFNSFTLILKLSCLRLLVFLNRGKLSTVTIF
jgi:hypothetical protein